MLAHIRKTLRRGARDAADRGASAVEYGLLIAAIAAVIVGVVFGLGTMVKGAFDNTCKAIASTEADPNCEAPADGGQ